MSEGREGGDARQTLCRVVATYGPDVRLDPRRCEALLRDLCPSEKRDINLLLLALRERVPDELVAAPAGQPPTVLVARLSQRLVDTLGLAAEAARWAVGSWALALGVASDVDLPAPVPAPPPYVAPKPAPPPVPLPSAPWRDPPPAPLAPPAVTSAEAGTARARLFLLWLAGSLLVFIGGTFLVVHLFQVGQPFATDRTAIALRHWEAAQPVSALALSPDGKVIATGGFKLITLWDANTGAKLYDITIAPPARKAATDNPPENVQPGEVARLRFSPDGSRLAAWDYGAVTLWDARTGQRESIPEIAAGSDVLEFTPDGRSLVAEGDGGSLSAWDAQTGVRRAQVAKIDASVVAVNVAVSPDGRTLAGGGSDGVVHLWDAVTGEPRWTAHVAAKSAAEDAYGHAQHFTYLTAVAFSPDGRTLATAHLHDTNVRFWDGQTGVPERVVPTGDNPVEAMTLRADSTFVCFQREDEVNMRDGTTGKRLHKYLYKPSTPTAFEPRPHLFALSADGRTMAAGGDVSYRLNTDPKAVGVWKLER